MSSVMSRMYVRITPWRSRCAVQPPDAENRTSGGVGGVTGLSRHLHPIKEPRLLRDHIGQIATHKKASLRWLFHACSGASGSVGGHFHIVSDEGDQSVLLAVGQLAEALQQFAFMQGQFRAVQAHAQLVTQRTFLDKALFQARDDLGVHAAVVVARYLGNALTHPIWQADDKLVSGAARINSLFHWAHIN